MVFFIGFLVFADNAGNRYGPRYYFEAFPFAILTVCSAVRYLVRSRDHGFARIAAVHLLASQVIIGLMNVPFLAWFQHRIISERMDLFEQVEAAQVSNAVVFVKSSTGVIREMPPQDLVRNGVDLKGDVIYALDLGSRNRCLIQHFPNRELWSYTREKGARQGVLERMTGQTNDLGVEERTEC